VADGRRADAEARRELFQAEALAGTELQAADLLPKRAVDTLLDGRDLERCGGRTVIFDF
jgi:hypothetical protein